MMLAILAILVCVVSVVVGGMWLTKDKMADDEAKYDAMLLKLMATFDAAFKGKTIKEAMRRARTLKPTIRTDLRPYTDSDDGYWRANSGLTVVFHGASLDDMVTTYVLGYNAAAIGSRIRQ